MSIALVVTRGYGNGTLTGTIKDVVLRGYAVGVVLSPWTKQNDSTDTWSAQADTGDTWTKQTDSSDTWTAQ